jgi:hypothetical protein
MLIEPIPILTSVCPFVASPKMTWRARHEKPTLKKQPILYLVDVDVIVKLLVEGALSKLEPQSEEYLPRI